MTLYRRLQEQGLTVTFVTYGDSDDLHYAEHIPGIRIICNRWGLPNNYYAFIIGRVYPYLWRSQNVIFKSNQVKGAEIALKAARRARKPFIARCGYLHSDFTEQQFGPSSVHTQNAYDLERMVFSGADQVVVTTPRMQETIIQRYYISSKRVRVIPNYVDTAVFYSSQSDFRPSNRRICFVGRFEEQKNLKTLLDAVRGLEVEIIFVGQGQLREELQTKARVNSVKAQFLGIVRNNGLPEILNDQTIFVLPSFYEGHPKVLIEAMSCGLPVIGTDVPGIKELIRHRENGYLCGTDVESLRMAINTVLNDPQLRKKMGQNAREYVHNNFALDRILALELDLLQSLKTP